MSVVVKYVPAVRYTSKPAAVSPAASTSRLARMSARNASK